MMDNKIMFFNNEFKTVSYKIGVVDLIYDSLFGTASIKFDSEPRYKLTIFNKSESDYDRQTIFCKFEDLLHTFKCTFEIPNSFSDDLGSEIKECMSNIIDTMLSNIPTNRPTIIETATHISEELNIVSCDEEVIDRDIITTVNIIRDVLNTEDTTLLFKIKDLELKGIVDVVEYKHPKIRLSEDDVGIAYIPIINTNKIYMHNNKKLYGENVVYVDNVGNVISIPVNEIKEARIDIDISNHNVNHKLDIVRTIAIIIDNNSNMSGINDELTKLNIDNVDKVQSPHIMLGSADTGLALIRCKFGKLYIHRSYDTYGDIIIYKHLLEERIITSDELEARDNLMMFSSYLVKHTDELKTEEEIIKEFKESEDLIPNTSDEINDAILNSKDEASDSNEELVIDSDDEIWVKDIPENIDDVLEVDDIIVDDEPTNIDEESVEETNVYEFEDAETLEKLQSINKLISTDPQLNMVIIELNTHWGGDWKIVREINPINNSTIYFPVDNRFVAVRCANIYSGNQSIVVHNNKFVGIDSIT